MAETCSLTTWPARRWKQFTHGRVLAVDDAFEAANAREWITHSYRIRLGSFSRFVPRVSPRCVFAFPWHGLRLFFNMQPKCIQTIINRLCLCSLSTKSPSPASKIPKRLRQGNHGAAIWLNGEDESRISFLHAF